METAPHGPDARRFRDTIGLFATGIAVVVAQAGGEVRAMTVNAVSSVSLDPMLALFCPGKNTRLGRVVTDLSGFTINFLRDDQQAVSSYFAGGWRDPAPPFRLVASRCAPRLEGSLACIDCEPAYVKEMGDHWLVVGRVLDLHVGVPPHRPLLFFQGRYCSVDFSQSTAGQAESVADGIYARVFYES